jgi:hypothetical protein
MILNAREQCIAGLFSIHFVKILKVADAQIHIKNYEIVENLKIYNPQRRHEVEEMGSFQMTDKIRSRDLI